MAFSAKLLCFLLLCFYISSLPIHARESQFFSKFSSYKPNTNNVEDNVLPPKEIVPGKQETEPEPTFTPENHNGYGLYGREIDHGTWSTYSPEKSLNEVKNVGQNTEYMFNNGNPYTTTKDSNVYENNDYNRNMNRFPVQQQGMSDTRFLENGKYYYDVNNEELYKNRYRNQVQMNDVFGPSGYRGENSRNQYNPEAMDDNLYRFNNFMENNNQGNQGEYIP